MSQTNHDEYLDYSCSTSVERLARDIEVILRSWHVDGGSDRHVAGRTTTPLLQGQATALIRSNQLAWNIQLYQQQRKIQAAIDLEITLWDASQQQQDKENKDSTDLPFSLQRNPTVTNMPLDMFNNFSTLFGIGQHISLVPINADELDRELSEYLATLVLLRHHRGTTAEPALANILSGWLQTALNMAISNCACYLPAFGVWGRYQPQQGQLERNMSLVPQWVPRVQRALPEQPGRFLRRHRGIDARRQAWNQRFVPPILTGQLISPDVYSTFWCALLPARAEHHLGDDSRLTVWASVLLSHCPDAQVALWGARHLYCWTKPQKRRGWIPDKWQDEQYTWRQAETTVVDLTVDEIERYRLQCREYALTLMESAAQAKASDPFWGPSDDPISTMHANVTWNGRWDEATGKVLPLLTMPLKIRSRQSMKRSDWIDMEDSIEQTILDPYRPSTFFLQTQFDHETPQTSLAANMRCVLAALIRTATLPSETMITHLTDKSIMDAWDSAAGNTLADNLAEAARVGPGTQSLVTALDWVYASEYMINDYQASDIIQKVLDGTMTLGFPSPPEGALFDLLQKDPTFVPLRKAAAPGRLLSILFTHSARVRSPSSMALVWKIFVSELRSRWDLRESLPNMMFVPGLDPTPDPSYFKRCFSVVGIKANFAAQANSTESDPDDFHCLIGQKLQLFNLCIETIVTSEMRRVEKIEKIQRLDDSSCDSSDNKRKHFDIPTTLTIPNGQKQSILQNQSKSYRSILHGTVVDGLPKVVQRNTGMNDDARSYTGQSNTNFSFASRSQQFYDADDAGSVFSKLLMDVVDEHGGRKGARCPVQGLYTRTTGEQIFAPYLQRPYPLTDDDVAQRRLMMLQQSKLGPSRAAIKESLTIVHRLQRPKLSSDMSAFKAANPVADFEDFLIWYGNPRNPFEETQEEQSHDIRLGLAAAETVTTFGKDEQAANVLNMTMEFWKSTWIESKPIAAIDQESLFDPSHRIEVALDYLETIHPASLLCQVMAVNLGNSFFALFTSAGDVLNIPVVQRTFERLREKVENALALLSLDVTTSRTRTASKTATGITDSTYAIASIETIAACERACNAIAETEILLARAMSLWQKLPRQGNLIETILSDVEGKAISVVEENARRSMYRLILEQKGLQNMAAAEGGKPTPSVREYLLRNMDELHPCQLCVRYGSEGVNANESDSGGLVMAVSKIARV